jgi:hypothetical protein
MTPAHMVESGGSVLWWKQVMTVVTALSTSCTLKAHHHNPSTRYRMTIGLNEKHIKVIQPPMTGRQYILREKRE